MNGVYIPVYKMGALGKSKQHVSPKWEVKGTSTYFINIHTSFYTWVCFCRKISKLLFQKQSVIPHFVTVMQSICCSCGKTLFHTSFPPRISEICITIKLQLKCFIFKFPKTCLILIYISIRKKSCSWQNNFTKLLPTYDLKSEWHMGLLDV